MVLDIILAVIFGLSLLGLLGLVWNKLPILKLIDVDNLLELKQQDIKEDLLAVRLKRKVKRWSLFIKKIIEPLRQGWSNKRQALQQSVKELEQQREATKVARSVTSLQGSNLFEQAAQAARVGNLSQAEKIYLEIIGQQPHNLEAYQGLAEVYLENRDYEQAREVYEYLAEQGRAQYSSLGLARVATGQGLLEEAKGEYLKSLSLSNAVQPRLELAYIYQQLGDIAEAWQQVVLARELEPNSPKVLDFYIELSIVNGHLTEAQEALDTLREVNPDNKKIADFVLQIREQAQKTKPVKRRSRSNKTTSFGVDIS